MSNLDALKALLTEAEADLDYILVNGTLEEVRRAKDKVQRLRSRVFKLIQTRPFAA